MYLQPTPAQDLSTSIRDEVTTTTEAKSENLAAESNISVQSVSEDQTTTTIRNKPKFFKPAWLPTTVESQQITQSDTIPPANNTRSTGFESITKLPSGVTTPRDENVEISETNDTTVKEKPITDYEITTIRFSYVPTEPIDYTEINDYETESSTEITWHRIIPTRTKFTKTEETPITTYRPKYITTTEAIEESTVTVDTTPPVIEVSSQILDKTTDNIFISTYTTELTTTEPTTTVTTRVTTTESTTNADLTTEVVTTEENIQPLTVQVTTPLITTAPPTTITTFETTTHITTTTPIPTTPTPTTPTPNTTTPEDTTTIVVEVVTEINTEREKRITTTEKSATESETDNEVTTDCTSEENENSNEIINQSVLSSSTSTSTSSTTTEKQKDIPTTERQITTTEKPDDTTQLITTERVAPVEIVTKVPFIPEANTEIPQSTPNATTERSEEVKPTTHKEEIMSTTVECSTEADVMTKPVNGLEDLTDFPGEMTTEASSRVLSEESGTGAAVAIAVSTIGVIALVLLIGLLVSILKLTSDFLLGILYTTTNVIITEDYIRKKQYVCYYVR